MMKFYLVLLLTMLLARPGRAQNHENDYVFAAYCGSRDELPCQRVVVALGGVKLRQSPAFTGQVIATLPFGTVVEALELEPLGKYFDKNTSYMPEDRFPMAPDSVHGVWMRVRVGAKTGWVFSAFLANALHRMTAPAYLLVPNAGTCWNDAFASLEYRYYGIFPDRDRRAWQLRPVRPVFYNDLFIDADNASGTRFRVSGEPQQPYFVLASKAPLVTGTIGQTAQAGAVIGEAIHDPELIAARHIRKVPVPNTSWTLELETVKTPAGHPDQALVLVDQTGKKQRLLNETWGYRLRLLWVGDLDGDGQPDFVIEQDGEKTVYLQLFLTRGARNGNLVVPAPRYLVSAYCC